MQSSTTEPLRRLQDDVYKSYLFMSIFMPAAGWKACELLMDGYIPNRPEWQPMFVGVAMHRCPNIYGGERPQTVLGEVASAVWGSVSRCFHSLEFFETETPGI